MAIYFKIALLMAVLCTVHSRQPLELIHNGYEGLIVGISDAVPESHCNKVIHGLKVVLAQFSSLLWKATGGRASIRDVTVSLPKMWRTNSLTCSLLQSLDIAVPPIKPHISIKGPHPLFGTRPWAQQSQGCGSSGDFIQMGADALRSNSNESRILTAKQLLNEWVKFRWGVFDENGHKGDPLYPESYRDPIDNEIKPNRCVESLSAPFCDSKKHIPEAPTKHNALCMGRPAWDIIRESEDFRNGKNPPSNITTVQGPNYRFVQEGSPRFILAVEDTAVMNMQRRWEFVRKSVRRTVVYDVPDGAYMGLVVFNSVAKTVAPLSKIDSVSDVRQRIGSSLPRNPSTVPESHKCLLCGIQEALRSLESDSIGAAGANIILVTSGTGTATPHEMDEIVRLVQTRDLRITPIVYPLTEKLGSSPSATTKSLEFLVRANGHENGRLFTVVDEGVGKDSKVTMMVSLMDALLASVRLSGAPENPGTPVVVHNKAYPGGISSMSSGGFMLDNSLGSNVRFSVYYYDLNHVGNTIQLTSPSGKIMASGNMQEEDGDANVIFVNIPKAERGQWRYNVENRADSHQGLQIQVTAFESPLRKVSIKLWTNSEGSSLNMVDSSRPLILYAQVKDGEAPVIGSQVKAKLQRLGTNATGFPYEPIFINLLDNGVGDPDITKGDGIYSRYLPQVFTFAGHYELSVTADNNRGFAKAPSIDSLTRRARTFGRNTNKVCCGSELKYEHMKPIAPFQREVTYGILNVISSAPETDNIPPSRILDLRADVNETMRTVTLTWTAPGDDYDWGRAKMYDGILASSWAEAKAFEGEHIGDLPNPHEVSIEQSFVMDIDKYDQISYIAIRAIDSVGNRAGISNIVAVWVPHPPTTLPPPTTPNADLPSSYSAEPQGHGLTQPIRLAGMYLEDIAVIAGSVVGLIIVVAMLVSFCYCHISSKKKEKNKGNGDQVLGDHSIVIKSDSALMDQEDSRDSADSVVKDIDVTKDGRSLSPAQSWAPSKLLGEHEKRYSTSSGAVIEQHGNVSQYIHNINEPFPDVTLTTSHPYPSSQTPSTTHSEPPAYQPYGTESYSVYPYQNYQSNFPHEELPPYTQAVSSQSSQSSAFCGIEQITDVPFSIENNIRYTTENPSFDGSLYVTSQPSVFMNPSESVVRPIAPGGRKVPPPVAPKPQMGIRPTNISPSNGSNEYKRRNVTQV